MKYSALETLDDYFQKTEHAVRHYYAGLDSCWAYYREASTHWDVSKVNEPMTVERKEALDRYLKLADKYFDLKISEAMFAGSILQMAYIAIRFYSKNQEISETYRHLVKNKTGIQFCVGPELYGIPAGLIIYAARNQFAHWDDEQSHPATSVVFDALTIAIMDNMFADLAFSLSNPSIPVYAKEVLLTALRWDTYDKYLEGIRDILK